MTLEEAENQDRSTPYLYDMSTAIATASGQTQGVLLTDGPTEEAIKVLREQQRMFSLRQVHAENVQFAR